MVLLDIGVVVTTTELLPFSFLFTLQKFDSHHEPELDIATGDVSGTVLRVGLEVLVEYPLVETTML